MSTAGATFSSSASRPLALRMRGDLRQRRQRYAGQACRIVKDPIALKYFRFQEEEYALLEMLDGRASLEDIKRRFESRFAPQRVTYSQIQEFVGTAHRNGLVISDAPLQGRQLWQRSREVRRQKRIAGLSNVLALRWRGFDPDWLLGRLLPLTSWFFARGALSASALLVLSALGLLCAQYDTFRLRLPGFHEFFGPANWFWLALTLGVVKVLHELGHGLACRRFGGECHEIGFMLLVFTPALYCNVSDSWMLPNKWQRAAIGAAGMYVELTLASLATMLWWISEPGLFNHLCLSVMFVCSVSTLLFNGNPLMRFDGYYILADLVEIPNLRQKSTDLVRRFLYRGGLGIELPADPYLPPRTQLFLGIYGVASVVYRWVVVFSIVLFLNALLEPYGLRIIGRLLGLVAILTLVVPMIWQVGRFFRVPGKIHEMKRLHVAVSTAGLLSVSLAVLLVPVPHYVTCPLTVEPLDASGVFVASAGTLESIFVEPGQAVARGDALARLTSPDLARSVIRLQRELNDLDRRIRLLQRERFADRQAGLELPALHAELAATREELAEKQVLVIQLTIESPAAGLVYPTLRTDDNESRKDNASSRNTWPLDRANCGAFLPRGTELCRIGSADRQVAMLVIDQGDIDWVRRGQRVSIQLESAVNQTRTGAILNIAECELPALPASLATQSGGEVAARSHSGGVVRPASPSYQARVPLATADNRLPIGLRGTARIDTGSRPLAIRLWRSLSATFHFRL